MEERFIADPSAARWLGALAAVALTCLLITAPAAATTPARGLGVNAQELLLDMPRSEWGVHLREMQRDHVSIVRTDAFWASVEPSRPRNGVHHYNWSVPDAIVLALAQHRLRWLPIADYSTPWATSRWLLWRPDLYAPPINDSSFASYAAALAARYGPGGTFWRSHRQIRSLPVTAVEVWNEENGSTFWHPHPDADSYAQLYAAARNAVHHVVPSTQLIVGGLSPGGGPFLGEVLTWLHAHHSDADAVGIHPYAASVGAATAQLATVRGVLDAHGDTAAPIDVTEFGWSTGGAGNTLTDARRAQLLTATTDAFARSDCGVERITPYAWTTSERSRLSAQDWFGIVHPSGAPSGSATAYAGELAQLGNPRGRGSASISICHRALSLRLTPVRRRPRRLREPCLRALVLSGSASVARATVSIAFSARNRHVSTRRRVLTSARGIARVCGPQRAGVTWRFALVRAERWDYLPSPALLTVLRPR